MRELIAGSEKRRYTDDFLALKRYDVDLPVEAEPVGCDLDKGLMPD